jgi:hypothetical protein
VCGKEVKSGGAGVRQSEFGSLPSSCGSSAQFVLLSINVLFFKMVVNSRMYPVEVL